MDSVNSHANNSYNICGDIKRFLRIINITANNQSMLSMRA